jgi:hypothetical protein
MLECRTITSGSDGQTDAACRSASGPGSEMQLCRASRSASLLMPGNRAVHGTACAALRHAVDHVVVLGNGNTAILPKLQARKALCATYTCSIHEMHPSYRMSMQRNEKETKGCAPAVASETRVMYASFVRLSAASPQLPVVSNTATGKKNTCAPKHTPWQQNLNPTAASTATLLVTRAMLHNVVRTTRQHAPAKTIACSIPTPVETPNHTPFNNQQQPTKQACPSRHRSCVVHRGSHPQFCRKIGAVEQNKPRNSKLHSLLITAIVFNSDCFGVTSEQPNASALHSHHTCNGPLAPLAAPNRKRCKFSTAETLRFHIALHGQSLQLRWPIAGSFLSTPANTRSQSV